MKAKMKPKYQKTTSTAAGPDHAHQMTEQFKNVPAFDQTI